MERRATDVLRLAILDHFGVDQDDAAAVAEDIVRRLNTAGHEIRDLEPHRGVSREVG